jgi:protein TonB
LPERAYRLPPLSRLRPDDRTIAVSAGVSVAAHVLVMTITFAGWEPRRIDNQVQPLEVVLVNARTREAPVKPDALAQVHLDGGGNTEAPVRAKSPLPAAPNARDDLPEPAQAAQRRIEQLEAETQKMLTRLNAAVGVEPRTEGARTDPQPATPAAPHATDLITRGLEMARLQAQIDQNWQTYQQRPRRVFIGARAQEFRFARYVEDWRAKVERVGTLNFPDEARRHRIYGSLLLTVSIRRDGTVEQIELNRSSGFKVLDQAAIRIVELAAPYAAFPPDIAKDTDILSITRTWTFTTSDQFQGQ